MVEPIHIEITLPETCAGMRLDQALASVLTDYSRARLQEWVKNKQITVNGKAMRSKDKVQGGEHIILNAQLPVQEQWQAEQIDLDIVYEDEHIIVINKPRGLVVHPAAGNYQGTLLNAVLHHAPECQHLPRAGIVHRLDKDTSGIMVVARSLLAHKALVDQLQQRSMKREYQAIVYGHIIAGGTVDAAIDRHPVNRKKMAVLRNGKSAVTHYRVLERYGDFTLLALQLESGRTHQIRVHMAHIHHPIVGDPVYGSRLKIPANASESLQQALQQFKVQALHAFQLGLIHPATKQALSWQVPLAEDMVDLLRLLTEHREQQQD